MAFFFGRGRPKVARLQSGNMSRLLVRYCKVPKAATTGRGLKLAFARGRTKSFALKNHMYCESLSLVVRY